jgi:hypothetical protein
LLSDGRTVDTWIRGQVSEATYRTLIAVGAGELAVISNWVCTCQWISYLAFQRLLLGSTRGMIFTTYKGP